MTRKLLSLVTAIGMLYVYLQSQLHSSDALFLVTSDNIAVNLGLLALASAAIYISFSNKFETWQAYLATAAAAVGLGLVGLIGFTYVGLDNNFAGVIKPFDYIILMQLGITYGICALSYAHPAVEYQRPSYRLLILQLKQRLSSAISQANVTSASRTPRKPQRV